MAIYHLECYKEKYKNGEGECLAHHCLLILPASCPNCQKEVKKGEHLFYFCQGSHN